MPDSFYQALVIFIPVACLLLWAIKHKKPNTQKKVRQDIEHRLFVESPTFVTEVMNLTKDPGGFYVFRVEGLVANVTDGSLEPRIVHGSHSGTAFLKWEYEKPEVLDLKGQYSELYPKA